MRMTVSMTVLKFLWGFQRLMLDSTMSSINLVIFGLSILLIKTRPESPEARGRGKGPFVNLALLRRSEFWSVGLSLIVAVTAYG